MARRLDKALVERISRKTGRTIKSIGELVSRKAARKAIASEAQLVLLAIEHKIAANRFLRTLPSSIQQEVQRNLGPAVARVSADSNGPSPNRVRGKSARLPKIDLSESTEIRLAKRLSSVNADFGNSYRQIVADLRDKKRRSFKGPANEMRELFREILLHFAPDNCVTAQPWYVESGGEKPGPTRAQRIRYILEKEKEFKVADASAAMVEINLVKLGTAFYDRSSRATHTERVGKEVTKLLGYLNPILDELLDAAEQKSK